MGILDAPALDSTGAPLAKFPAVNRNFIDTKGPSRQTTQIGYARRALALRESAPFDIVFIGHSLFEGEGATSMFKRGTDRFRDCMRTRFPVAGVTGGYGFVRPRTASSTWANPYWTDSGGTYSGNYGNGSYFVNAAGAKVVLNSIVCTAVDVLYVQGGGGTFSTKTDGVANGDTKATTGSPTQIMKYRVPGISGPAAAHTVEVNYVSGNSIICGFMIYSGDESTGIRVWNFAQGGLTSAQMQDPSNQKRADLATIAPSLVVVTAGANDFKTGVTPATSKAQINTLLTQIRVKAPNASLLLNVEHELGSVGSPVAPWAEYAANYYALADERGDCAVFDFWQRVGLGGPPQPAKAQGIIHADNQHYTDAGYLMWAEALAGFISP